MCAEGGRQSVLPGAGSYGYGILESPDGVFSRRHPSSPGMIPPGLALMGQPWSGGNDGVLKGPVRAQCCQGTPLSRAGREEHHSPSCILWVNERYVWKEDTIHEPAPKLKVLLPGSVVRAGPVAFPSSYPRLFITV